MKVGKCVVFMGPGGGGHQGLAGCGHVASLTEFR